MNKLAWIVLFLLIGLAIVTPMLETIDSWDDFAHTGQDLELSIICLFVGLGIVLLIRSLRHILRALLTILLRDGFDVNLMPSFEQMPLDRDVGSLSPVPLRI